MKSLETPLIIGLIIVAIFNVLGWKSYDGIKQQAISRGFAEYNQTNGNWQWRQLEDKTK